MRLTLQLLRKKLPRGHIWRGKYRLVWIPDDKAKKDLVGDYRREEQNMFYLRHPYLTLEQSSGHAKELKKHEQWLAEKIKEKPRRFPENVTLEKRLCHLRFQESWE
ncbi:ribosomal protein 63, mitochondrial [Schistocerca cancellata]|uniref:ribosomal protein 63, mitochondrial n=1 Tax=Schistocerca cancellata TaxID=274614 RepID=UPI0021184A4A|nr:ribosomal protein 63, mitochondrial [Schistocerca cancellata]